MAEDRGMQISRLARALTRAQAQELFAIAHTAASTKVRCRIMAFHYRGSVLGPLVRDGLVAATPKVIGRQSMHSNRLTDLGTRVLLARLERELPWLVPASDEEAA